MKRLIELPIHPILLAIFPIYSLLAHNIREISAAESTRVFLVTLAGVGILNFLFWLLHRNWRKAALLTTLFAILFFGYGHIYTLIEDQALLGFNFGRHRYLALLWLVIIIFSWRWIFTRQDVTSLTVNLNWVGLALLIYPTIQILNYQYEVISARSSDLVNSASESPELSADLSTFPDIYYIVLDAYTRDDTMLDFYEFDNTPFLDDLETRGFYVARCSQSNYARTFLSLSSSLNLDYLQVIYPTNDEGGLKELIEHNRFRSIVEDVGYQSVAIKSGFLRTEWKDVDVYITPQQAGDPNTDRLGGINDFEALVFNTTAGLFLMDANTTFGGNLVTIVNESPKFERHQKIEFVLDAIEKVPAIDGPKLVFAHVLAPHEPYIFDENGIFLPNQEAYIPGYGDQVTYLNKRILSIVDTILANSTRDPIIIVQGDHGGDETKGDYRRLHILNAYYLPDGKDEILYPTITPVNTFRLILKEYFGLNYELLPDRSYYSNSKIGNFNFTEVPVERPDCDGL